MKRILLIVILTYITISPIYAIVDFSGYFAIPYDDGPACLGNQYFEVGFHTNFELNNDQFQIQRSTDPNFSWAITSTSGFNGNIDGCGTCSGNTYAVLDYGPFAPGEQWYYRVKATSNSSNISYYEFGSPITINMPSIVDWTSQVSHVLTIGDSPDTESSYTWTQEPTRTMQGVSVSLMPTEISHLYLEQNNNKINFNTQATIPFYNLEVNVNNSGFVQLYSGSGATNFIWDNSSGYFNLIGDNNLKVRFTDDGGTIFYREFNVHVVPKSDELHVDNYCNMIRVWKSNDPGGGIPIVFSEGFDAYNLRAQQFFMYAGQDLSSCLLDKGFDIYIINYNLNSQSLKNNAAIYQSAARYVSSINGNQDVVAMGISMGGVICRYACAKAENDGIPLPISKYVSLDAPHQGAVVSELFQDWRKQQFDSNPDPFAEYNLTNSAAKELLIYSAWDPNSLIHNDFFNTLNNLNGDGYPHLVESIGVSFSNSLPNPSSGQWVEIDVTGIPFYNGDESFDLTEDEKLAGSYLPPLNIDPSPVFSKSTGFSTLLNVLRPFSDPTVTITQTANPTFIPHESALDIIAGQSMFDQVIIPNTTGFHDQIPPDIIHPLVNALLKDVVYVQNIDYYDTRTIIAGEYIYAGNAVTLSEPTGDVNVHSGANLTMKAGTDVVIDVGFNVLPGGVYDAIIDDVDCNGDDEYQHKSFKLPIELSENASIKYEEDNSLSTSTIESNSYGLESQEFTIYPNPTNDVVTIEFSIDRNSNNIVEFELLDMTGRVVKKIPLINDNYTNSLQIDLKSLSVGFYRCIMKVNSQSVRQEIIIKQ